MNHRRVAIAPAVLLLTLTHAMAAERSPSLPSVFKKYCFDCHDADNSKGNLDLAAVSGQDVAAHPDIWEKVVRQLNGRQMPPAGKKRPDDATYADVIARLGASLDQAWAQHPNAGRTDTIRRLTRTEYQNAVRDLLAVDIDASSLLPADDAGHGFDDVASGNLSATLLERYITAAQKIARLAVGGPLRSPGGETIRIKPDVTQEQHAEGLPIGTRGGTVVPYTFPRDGAYDVQVRLTRDRNEHVEGLHEPAELEVLLDRERVGSFTVKPPADKDFQHVDDHLKVRMTVKAGPHDLGVTFVKEPKSLLETVRQPYLSRFNMHRSPRNTPAVYQVTITGPFADKGPGDTPSRRRIFLARPKSTADEESCAKQVLLPLMRRAYRRPVADADLDRILPLFRQARQDADFDAGIEAALSGILVSREFLFRVEHDPAGVAPHTAYRIRDIELASRLSLFLWSSIPDDELLAAAEHGELHEPSVLARQTRRMLADTRSRALVTHFAEQWLGLRTLDAITPDGRLFPDFDDNLRQAFRRETELLFDDVLRGDRSVLELIRSDHTWLNERLAKHYGIDDVYGTRFRRVTLDPAAHRGGLLRQGSVLTLSSYATRTSPVIRGMWVLEKLLGSPPPPQPPNVPALEDNTVSASLPIRERLKQHRANPACASCHQLMDPVGFALENFDAVGRWRTMDEGHPVDCAGGFPDGSRFDGVDGLEAALLKRPEIFAGNLTEKLLTYALGRGVEYYDAPAVREIVRRAQAQDFRFGTLIEAVVASPPFQMRTSP
jgi:hypothetical protein